MDLDAILEKTSKGLDEIGNRQGQLNPRLRAILIVIDGKTTFGELLDKFKLIDDVENEIKSLLEQNFIRALLDFKKQRMALSHILTDILGPGADMLTMKLEDCKTMEELSSFILEKQPMLDSILGPRASIFWDKFAELSD